MTQCHYCQLPDTKEELRPYGPDGAWVCFDCATATPEREAQTRRAFNGILSEHESKGTGTMLTDKGPIPYIGGK